MILYTSLTSTQKKASEPGQDHALPISTLPLAHAHGARARLNVSLSTFILLYALESDSEARAVTVTADSAFSGLEQELTLSQWKQRILAPLELKELKIQELLDLKFIRPSVRHRSCSSRRRRVVYGSALITESSTRNIRNCGQCA